MLRYIIGDRDMHYYGLNRTLCDVIREMRDIFDKGDPGGKTMRSLIEETQVMANRMESALSDVHDIEYLHGDIKKLKAELKKLKEEKQKLKPDSDSDDS